MLEENTGGILNCPYPANESTDKTSIMIGRILPAGTVFFIVFKIFWLTAISDIIY
jgi:hypothetical protein